MTTAIRPGRLSDAQRCGAICYEAFRTVSVAHRFPPDFPSVEAATAVLTMTLSTPDVYAVVAESDGRVVGSNFLWEHSSIAGVGPVTVDPSVQDGRVGRRLMEAVLARAAAKSWPGIRLVQAAYHNRSLSLYAKLGFDAREPLSNMQGPPIRRAIAGHAVRQATPADLDAGNRLCRRVHGHDRSRELRAAIERGSATVVEREGRITGYATLLGFFGHAVGETNPDVQALIAAAAEFAGPGILVPTRNADLLRWCLANGLRIVQPLTLMSVGLYNEPQGAFLPSIVF